jgi:hypothetical protein
VTGPLRDGLAWGVAIELDVAAMEASECTGVVGRGAEVGLADTAACVLSATGPVAAE